MLFSSTELQCARGPRARSGQLADSPLCACKAFHNHRGRLCGYIACLRGSPLLQPQQPLQPNELAPPTAARQVFQSTADVLVFVLLLPSHVLFTGSSSETWSNGGLSLPNNQRQQVMDVLIAQATVRARRDFCPVFSSSAGLLQSDAVASFLDAPDEWCRPVERNNCFGCRPIDLFWTQRAVPAGRVPDTTRHSPRLLV